MTTITEAEVEQAVLDWLSSLGWQVALPDQTGLNKPEIGRLTE